MLVRNREVFFAHKGGKVGKCAKTGHAHQARRLFDRTCPLFDQNHDFPFSAVSVLD